MPALEEDSMWKLEEKNYRMDHITHILQHEAAKIFG